VREECSISFDWREGPILSDLLPGALPAEVAKELAYYRAEQNSIERWYVWRNRKTACYGALVYDACGSISSLSTIFTRPARDFACIFSIARLR
jgi:hypothetical protein